MGGMLWLDLVNTQTFTAGGAPLDWLADEASLTAWRTEQLVELRTSAEEGLLDRLRALRSLLGQMAERIESGEPPSEAHVAGLNEVLGRRTHSLQLEESEGQLDLRRKDWGEPAQLVAAEFAESAARFLVESDRGRLRRCANPVCLVHFFDSTKNGARRFLQSGGVRKPDEGGGLLPEEEGG